MENLRKAFKESGKEFDEQKYTSCIKAYNEFDEEQRWDVCFYIKNSDATFADVIGRFIGKFKEPIEMLQKAIADSGEDIKPSQDQIEKFNSLPEDEQEEVCILVAEYGEPLSKAIEDATSCIVHNEGRYKSWEEFAWNLIEEGLFDIDSSNQLLNYIDWDSFTNNLAEDYSTWSPDDGGDEIFYRN